MEKLKKSLNEINYIWIIMILIYIFVGGLFLLYSKYTKFSLVNYANRFYIINIITFILCIMNYILKKNFGLVDIIIIVLISIAMIVTYFSDYRKISLFGHTTRCEGMITLIVYYLLFILSTFIEEKDKKKIIKSVLIFGILNVAIGILQELKIIPGLTEKYAKGIVGNSNFYSTQNIIWLSLSLGLFIFSKNWLYFILVLVFSIGLSIGGAMSCFVGLFCVLISILFIIIYNRKNINLKQSIKKYIFSIGLIFTIVIIISSLIDSKLTKDIKKLIFQSNDVLIKHNFEDNYGTNRMFIWKRTIPKIKENLLIGVGIDCFRYAFKPLLIYKGKIVSKAHNEYLQYLITEGIFCLIFYLLLLIVCIYNNFKRIKKEENYTSIDYSVLFCVIGYITQAFFNISVIRVAPLFYIILGLCYKRKNKALKLNKK